MILDFDMLKEFYASYSQNVDNARKVLDRPLTYAEKVLYSHLYDASDIKSFRRGEDYVDFRPNRVAMQDATAQMALLQFMNAGKAKVAVPASVHCRRARRRRMLRLQSSSVRISVSSSRYATTYSTITIRRR